MRVTGWVLRIVLIDRDTDEGAAEGAYSCLYSLTPMVGLWDKGRPVPK